MNYRIDIHRDNIYEHGVDEDEAVEAFHDGWPKRRKDGDCLEVLGRTEEGRYLQLVIEIKTEIVNGKSVKYIWLFHARDMTLSEKHRYRK